MSAVVPVGAILLVASLAAVDANFLTSKGFSGRQGSTCLACHTQPDPLGREAELVVKGIPPTWQPGTDYPIEVLVLGGPPALPDPAPKGGMEMEADQGVLTALDGGLVSLEPTHISYNAAGAMVRAWNLTWTAPTVGQRQAAPGPATLWVAALAASGNHVVALGLGDAGERFDSGANATFVIPASPAARQAWNKTLLVPPSVSFPARLGPQESFAVEGRQQDANATAVEYRRDRGAWSRQEATATWRVEFGPIGPGWHTVEVRSVGAGRVSEGVVKQYGGESTTIGNDTPVPLPLTVAALAAVLFVRRGAP